MMEVIINILISIIIGIVCHKLLEVIVLLIMLVPLRSYAGGYHMKKTWHCIIATNVVVLAVVLSVDALTRHLSIWVLIIADILSATIICLLSPIDTEAKPLDDDERKLFKKNARIICVLELLINMELLIINLKRLTVIGVLSHVVLVVMLCLAKRQNYNIAE